MIFWQRWKDQWEERQFFTTVGKLGIYMQKNKAEPLLYLHDTQRLTQNSSVFNVTTKTIKLRRRYRTGALWHWAWQGFLGYDTRTTGNKSRSWVTSKCKLRAAKSTMDRVERPPVEREMFAYHMSNKRLIFRSSRRLLCLNNEKQSDEKPGKGLE